MAFPQHFLDELTARTDLASLAGAYTALKQKGGVWIGLCPFHNEKTPSFSLSRDNTMYYCFGCQAGGGAVQFLMKAENYDFADAVRELARRAGLDMPEDDASVRQGLPRKRLLELNTLAARWFHDTLSAPAGAEALAYMHSRGLTDKTARKWGLGAAPDAWDGLADALGRQGVTREELIGAGLCAVGKRGSLYDSFRDRLMFPIFDPGGKVIAFSGRALKADAPAKYKNSRETGAYIKSRTLYGLHRAKNSDRPYFILVEGNVDVPMLHQHGFDSTLASCGTALTDQQAALMKRYKPEVVLAFDSDEGGRTAVQKAVPKLEAAGLSIRVLALSGAKDPDEYLKRYGPGAMEALLSGARDPTDFRLAQAAAAHDLQSDEGRRAYLRAAEALLLEVASEAGRQVYAHRVAETAGVKPDAVLRDLDALRRRAERGAVRAAERAALYPRKPGGGAEEDLLRHMAVGPEYADAGREALTEADFTDPARRELFTALCGGVNAAALPEPAAALLARLRSTEFGALSDITWRGALEHLRKGQVKAARPGSDEDLLNLRNRLKP
ncbi:MAG: DNA primase [Oscillospiraceae bacterium]|nr:DNA primase [Oscillospiraceae bacterium]